MTETNILAVDPYCDTAEVEYLRIWSEGRLTDDGNCAHEWFVDGRTDDGRHTGACWSFDSLEDAAESLDEFADMFAPTLKEGVHP